MRNPNGTNMSLLQSYRLSRWADQSVFASARHALTPARMVAAVHVLRGKPTVYGCRFIGEVRWAPDGNDDLLLISNTIEATKGTEA